MFVDVSTISQLDRELLFDTYGEEYHKDILNQAKYTY